MTIDAAPVHHLELVPLGERAWRLCDHAPATHPDDDGVLIAYVEQLPGGAYETVWVYRGPRVDTYASLEEVLVAATRRLAPMVGTDSKPVPIPHRAPLSFR
ncbi:hypothetical protein [Microbacterium sulfonylureivorans]|uniref:hypothetical protein n=1 Tax=Microbacterium sulfonylureivorans TaxID=2486854 RepID=UPI000FD9B46E|nr:hypothetical protein [Microbacterium sulfonylureivorans]